jgi:hypothetical protein
MGTCRTTPLEIHNAHFRWNWILEKIEAARRSRYIERVNMQRSQHALKTARLDRIENRPPNFDGERQ